MTNTNDRITDFDLELASIIDSPTDGWNPDLAIDPYDDSDTAGIAPKRSDHEEAAIASMIERGNQLLAENAIPLPSHVSSADYEQ